MFNVKDKRLEIFVRQFRSATVYGAANTVTGVFVILEKY